MNKLAPLSEYEQSQDFLSLNEQGKSLFYDNYFKAKEQAAASEDDFNSYLSEDSSRRAAAFGNKYKAMYPEDTKVDVSKITPESNPDLYKEFTGINELQKDLKYNKSAPVNKFKADDMEDKERSFAYKPFSFKGTRGYSVKYPNGEMETLKGITSQSQLTEFIRSNRLDKFNGKRDGLVDILIGNDEYTSIYEQMSNTSTGPLGYLGEARKTMSGMEQGWDLFNVDLLKKGINNYKDSESTVAQLESVIAQEKKGFNPDKMKISQMEQEVQSAKDAISRKNVNVTGSNVLEALNPLADDFAINPEEARVQLTKRYKNLLEEMETSKKIKGTSAMARFNDYINEVSREGGDTESVGTFSKYFKKNPSQLFPYVASVASSALPDLALITGGAGLASIPGKAIGAAVTAQGTGFGREYTGTLLSEVQMAAAEQGLDINKPGVIDSLLDNQEFIEGVREKAAKRAGVISSADAVLGGAVSAITDTVKGAFKRALFGATTGMITEGSGEALAGLATEGKVNWIESINESLGGGGAAVATVGGGIIADRKQRLSDRVDAQKESIKEMAAGKPFRAGVMNRVEEIAESIGVDINSTEETDEESQERENMVKQRIQDDPSYSPTRDKNIPNDLNGKYEAVADAAKEDTLIDEEIDDSEESIVPQDDITTDSQLTEKGYGFLAKAFDFMSKQVTGLTPIADAMNRNKSIDRAAQVMQSRYMRESVNLLSNTVSFDRIMREVKESGYDEAAQGRLMTSLGLSENDKNRRVITNVLGNFWSTSSDKDTVSKHTKKGYMISEALDTIYREDFNVDSVYEMSLSKSRKINKDDILLNMAPDDITYVDGVKTTKFTAGNAESNAKALKQFNNSLKATQVRAPKGNPDTDNKFNEAVNLKRPGIDVVDVSGLGSTNLERAKALFDRYKGREFVIKPKDGYAGAGIAFSQNNPTPEKLAKLMDDNNFDYYAETKVDPIGKKRGFNEHRVHVYVDSAGKAHAFRNLTFNKSRSYFSQNRRADEGKEDSFFLVPDSPNDPQIKALQQHAEKLLSGNDFFRDTILGLDMALVDQDGQITPFVFETNPLTAEGMSGWLGYSASMHEILSEMTGRPSMMAGLYELSKLSLNKIQLTEISNRVANGLAQEYQEFPRFYEAVDKGIATFNQYIDQAKWIEGMRNVFVDMPAEFFTKLWDAIKSVFSSTVDVKFEEQQTGMDVPVNLDPEGYVLQNKKYSSLSEAVNDVVNNSLNQEDKDALNEQLKAIGATDYSLAQFAQAVISNPSIQQKLSNLKPIYTNANSLYSEAVETIRRAIGVPFNQVGLVHAAIEGNNKGKYLSDIKGKAKDGTEYSGKDAFTDAPRYAGDIVHKKGEVTQATYDKVNQAELEISKEDAKKQVALDIAGSRFAKLKKAYPALLKGYDFDGTNLPAIREIVIDYLNKQLDEVDGKGKNTTANKRKQAALLVENKALAVAALPDLVKDPGITDSQANYLVDCVEYVMDQTVDLNNLTTNQIKYYNSVLESLSDGGPPVGFKHIALKAAERKFINRFQEIEDKTGFKPLFAQPIANWRRRPGFGMFGVGAGSLVSQSSEVAYIAANEEAHRFLNEFMGLYKDNIDMQQLEEQSLVAEYYNFQEKILPKIRPIQANRIGIVARLTQYKTDPGSASPVNQIMQRARQLTESFPLMKEYDSGRQALVASAYDSIIGSTDLSTLGDENAIISFLENQLTGSEREILDKAREMGSRLLPALKTVKAITKKATLENWTNYVHDSSITPTNKIQDDPLKALGSMADVLHDREGINPLEAFPEVDIRAVVEHQAKSSTYEKHTGVERFLLTNMLGSNSPVKALLNSGGKLLNPVSDRLSELLIEHHNSMTKHQEKPSAFISLLESLIQSTLGHLIVGVNAAVKNMSAAFVSRSGLTALSEGAYTDSFILEQHPKIMWNFIKKHSPTQFNRTSQYDNLEPQQARWGVLAKYKSSRDVGDQFWKAAIKSLPHVPKAVLDGYSKTVLNKLSDLSNGLPEKWHAFSIWTAAYVHYGKINGTIKDSNDFIANQQYDPRAVADANAWVDRSLGYSPNKAGKGSFWNGSSRVKQVLARSLFVFRQQASGLSIEFQNNVVRGVTAIRSGDLEEAGKRFKLAGVLMANNMTFRYLSIVAGSAMLWGGLERYISGDDEEKKRKEVEDAKRRYTLNSGLSNTGSWINETISMATPVTSASFILEPALSFVADKAKLLFDYDLSGANKGIHEDEATFKKNIKIEIDEITERVKELNSSLLYANSKGIPVKIIEEEIEKLELAKEHLNQKYKFTYFPNQPVKAFATMLGGYGIGSENLAAGLEALLEDDLDDNEKNQIKRIANSEFAYKDTIAGPEWASDMLHNVSDLARQVLKVTTLGKADTEQPTSLFWKSFIKVMQNPSVIVERAQAALAEEAYREHKATERRVDAAKKKYGY